MRHPRFSDFLAILSFLSFLNGALSSKAEDRLQTELFTNRQYNRLSRAVQDYRDTVNVRFAVQLVKIVEVDEYNEVMRANLIPAYFWYDYRLTWNSSDFDGINEIYVEPSSIWQPDIRLWNNGKVIKEFGSGLDLGFVRLNSSGYCRFFSAMEMSVSQCDMDITWFPFDEQRCPLGYESWKHEGHEVNLTPDKDPVYIDNTSYRDSGQWRLIAYPVTESTTIGHASPFTRVTITLHLRRKYLYYVINLIFPCALLSILAIVSFVLPPACGERIGLGITVLLSLSVYQMVINEKLPATSDATPILGIYFTFVIAICALSITMSVVVINIYQRSANSTSSPLPKWAKTLLCDRLAKLLRMRIRSKEVVYHQRDQFQNEDTEKEERYLLPAKKGVKNNAECDVANVSNAADKLLVSIKNLLEKKVRTDSEDRDVRRKSDELTSDWMTAALVLDRFFFVVCTFFLFVGSAVLLILITGFHR